MSKRAAEVFKENKSNKTKMMNHINSLRDKRNLLNKIEMLEQRIKYLEDDLEHFNRKYEAPVKKETSFSDIFDFPTDKPKRAILPANVYISQIKTVHFNTSYQYKEWNFNKYFIEFEDIEGIYIVSVRIDESQPQIGLFMKFSIIDGTIKSFKIFENED